MVKIAHSKTPIGPVSKLEILRAASLVFSRHYILVLRAEVGNWFYICKRAVKLSWLSFQYFSTEPPPSQIQSHSLAIRFVYNSSCY